MFVRLGQEDAVAGDLGQRFRSVDYAAKYANDHNRPPNNISSVRDLAALKDFAPTGASGTTIDLVPAAGREAQVRQLAATWPVGPRLDELVHRARRFRRSAKKDGSAGYRSHRN